MGDVGAGGDGGNEGCEACAFPHRHRAHTCARNTGGVGPLRAKPGDGDGGLSALGSGESSRAFTHSVCRESRRARVDGGACRWSPAVSLSAAISYGRRCGSSGLVRLLSHTVRLRRSAVGSDQRGLGVVVIHPGSYELRVGMAWDRQPKESPPFDSAAEPLTMSGIQGCEARRGQANHEIRRC